MAKGEDDLRWREERERRLADRNEKGADEGENAATSEVDKDQEEAFKEKDDEDLYFLPDRGNVIFASAIDGWGFRVGKFAQRHHDPTVTVPRREPLGAIVRSVSIVTLTKTMRLKYRHSMVKVIA